MIDDERCDATFAGAIRLMRDHRKLKAFQLADDLVLHIYSATRGFPKDERFGLTSQLRRAAISIPGNIVEGSARTTQREYVRFLEIALGSVREVGYYIDLAHRLGYLSQETVQPLRQEYDETARVLAGLVQSLQKSH